MKKLLLSLVAGISLAACTAPKNESSTESISALKPVTYQFLVGTYTDSAHQGINQLIFSPEENLMSVGPVAAGISNPSFVISNAKGNLVFSLEEEAGVQGGRVLSFSRNLTNSELTLVDQEDSKGDHPCHISLSPQEDFVILGNYTGGSLSVFKVDSIGQLDFVQLIQHQGKSVNPERQEAPHVHSTTFDPEGKRVLVADLGTDRIYVYRFDPSASEPLALEIEVPVTEGDGPRHLAFSADGKEVLVVEELTATLDVFAYESGKLTPKQRLSLLAPDFQGAVGAAEIRISPDGKHVYVSNRGDANTITVFAKNSAGLYELVEITPSGGKMPRNFNLTPDGKYLLVAHQASNDLVIFERNAETGKLTPTPWKAQINKPVYLYRLPQ